jgi:hypothetical protein
MKSTPGSKISGLLLAHEFGRSLMPISELGSIRSAARDATEVAIERNRAEVERAEAVGDHTAAGFHRGEVARLQPAPLANLEAIDWGPFWGRERTGAFLVDPWLAAGRQTALYGPAKSGKSELVLYAAAGYATGRDLYGREATPGVCLYLDFEMTEDDVDERLRDFGYGPDTDLSRLVYVQHPTLPPLDTKRGGDALAAEIDAVGAELVVIDTLSKVVEGEENSNDTFVGFARHTGKRLRQRDCGLLRVDHSGKDTSRGARGASAKMDDVDAVYRLTQRDRGVVSLELTHRRVAWLDSITLRRVEDNSGVRYIIDETKTWPDGTADAAARLDELGSPLDIGGNEAVSLLRENGYPTRREIALAAVRYRKDGNHNGTTTKEPTGNRSGTTA